MRVIEALNDSLTLVGTWDKGLYLMNKPESTGRYYWAEFVQGFPFQRIRATLRVSEKEIWIGTSGGGIISVNADDVVENPAELPFRTIASGGVSRINDLDLLDSKTVLASTWSGLSAIDLASGEIYFHRNDPDNKNTIGHNTVNQVLVDQFGAVWAAHDGGVSFSRSIDFVASETVVSPGVSFHNFSVDNASRIVAGTSRGVFSLGPEGDPAPLMLPWSHEPPFISSISFDDQSMMLATGDEGLWYASQSGELAEIELPAFDFATPASQRSFTSVIQSGPDSLWAASAGAGLYLFTNDSGRWTLLESYNSDSNPSLGTNAIVDMLIHADGRPWLATTARGIYALNLSPGFKTVDSYPQGTSLGPESYEIRHLNKMQDSRVLVASSRGAWMLEPDGSVLAHISTLEGIPSDDIRSILADGNTIWFAGPSWVCRSDTLLVNHECREILASKTASQFTRRAIIADNTEVYLGTDTGLISLTKDRWNDTERIAPNIRLLTEKGPHGGVGFADLVAPRGVSSIRLAGEYLNLTSATAPRFRLVLEGAPNPFRESAGTMIDEAFSGITPRSDPYRLTLQVFDDGGLAFSESVMLSFRPHIWQTTWFLVTAFLVLALAAVSTFVLSMRQQLARAAETQLILTDGQEKERAAISRELHDSPLQRLYMVGQAIGEELSRSDDSAPLSRAASEIDSVIDELRRICGELRPPGFSAFGLESSLRTYVRNARKWNPDVDFIEDYSIDYTPEERVSLAAYRVVSGAIANVLRHSGASCVSICIESSSRAVLVKISDDGVGFDVPSNLLAMAKLGHYGLVGMSEWTRGAGGKFLIESSPGNGTTISCSFPHGDPSHRRQSRLGNSFNRRL